MAAVVAVLQVGGQVGLIRIDACLGTCGNKDQRPYSEFQFAKLKGFSCAHNNSSLQPIWDYFKTAKEVMHIEPS